MTFKIYDCDFGIKFNGVNYDFTHVDSLTIEDPENTKLVRGTNAGNKIGLSFKEGLKEPKKWTIPILGMSAALKAVLDDVYNGQARVDLYCIARSDGSSKMAKNAVLCNAPQQLSISEGPESMNVSLMFMSFDTVEAHKS